MNINYKIFAVIFAICQLFQSIVNAAPTINQEIYIDSIMVVSQAIHIYPKSINSTRMEHYHAEHNVIEW